MPALIILNSDEITREMYEALRKEVGWDAIKPRGLISHVAGHAAGHLCVADLWEEPMQFQEFFNSRLLPAMKKLGIPVPTLEMYQTINVNGEPPLQLFVVPTTLPRSV